MLCEVGVDVDLGDRLSGCRVYGVDVNIDGRSVDFGVVSAVFQLYGLRSCGCAGLRGSGCLSLGGRVCGKGL